MNNTVTKKNPRLLIALIFIVIGMFGFCFALIPMYTVMCKTLGLNGKTQNTAAGTSARVDTTRTITVEFMSTINENLPWDFYPLTKKIDVHPGQNQVVEFVARNKSDHTMTVQAIPSVSPGLAAQYLKKTECFCFTQQTFKSGEQRKMPILFHLDTDLPKDIKIVAVSYSMFDTANLGHVAPKKQGHI